jgi:cellobiose phosphorylase
MRKQKKNTGTETAPIHTEMLDADQMRAYGRTLAESHVLGQSKLVPDVLLRRLNENERVLGETRNILTESILKNKLTVPAADWFLDNYYLVEEHIRTSRRDLPRGYSRELPRLATETNEGLPRVYDIAIQRIAHGDGLVDPETLPNFMDAYQSKTILTLGELWAIPIMLRLALIDNLRWIAGRITDEMKTRDLADFWAEKMISIAAKKPMELILTIAEMAKSEPVLDCTFVAEFSDKIQGRGPELALCVTWMEQVLLNTGTTIERLVQAEMQQQASNQVSVSNSIRSLRSLGAKDWKDFVDRASVVEKILARDPAMVYPKMDFATRDRYRHVIETLAKKNGMQEAEVASCAIRLSNEQFLNGGNDRRAHVGFFLIDKGNALLGRSISGRRTIAQLFTTAIDRVKFPLYVFSVFLLAILLAWLIGNTFFAGRISMGLMAVVQALAFLGTLGLSANLVNACAMMLTKPNALPRMDYSKGIPDECRTLIIVPSMLTSAGNIDSLVDGLEVRFLANDEPNLLFGLLTDFSDADECVMPNDDFLITYAQKKIGMLNAKYRGTEGGIMYLFHRGRLWNESQRSWIGYERKRGKLESLNDLLRGNGAGKFDVIVGDTSRLRSVTYVITLDTDTQLPRDSAKMLIATMAHPLNKPVYDSAKKRVTEGYGIMQPGVCDSLSGSRKSLYAMLNAGESGIDPYTKAVSDVYQDLFSEGSFVGKGIYDVDAFIQTIKGRFPENRILSHDLLEGCYARSGLMSDVQLFEESPVSYEADTERRKRWIRGDWQLLRWVFPFVPTHGGHSKPNPLSALSRWKLADNIRRSLSSLATVILMTVGWTMLSESGFFIMVMIGVIFLPSVIGTLSGFLRKPKTMSAGAFIRQAAQSAAHLLSAPFFALATLPYDAYFSATTIVRTLVRVSFTHRNLLEWKPSAQHDSSSDKSLASSIRSMWIAPALSAVLFAVLLRASEHSLMFAIPVLVLWSASPVLAWSIGRPVTKRKDDLSGKQVSFLRGLSRKTWSFFETFLAEEDNWLPPDNYQEIPVAKTAHRTSPTNMGLALLSNVTALDFGYITTAQMLERTKKTLSSMESLEKYRGHYYNWYDTTLMCPLYPLYVSTVDSGNLSACLMTLHAALNGIGNTPIIGNRLWEGLTDTLLILEEKMDKSIPEAFTQFETTVKALVDGHDTGMKKTNHSLLRLSILSKSINAHAAKSNDQQLLWWAQALDAQCDAAIREIRFAIPWIDFDTAGDSIPSNVTPVDLAAIHEAIIGASETQNPSLIALVGLGQEHASERIAAIGTLASKTGKSAEMDFSFLFDRKRRLFTIGYTVDTRRPDSGYYDLLASEARLTSFIAIAQGQIPQENWFSLGRSLTDSDGEPILLSWSGSMFEYLMPLLFMPGYKKTLLGQTCSNAVESQIRYGKLRGVPWGISESGYNSFDIARNYQYRSFGIPSLGLKRGLFDDLVIAPYASALALMVLPASACHNLQRLSGEGFVGDYGFYEAIDYTKSRILPGKNRAIVRSFMAHHQGMSFLSFASYLLDSPMQSRFLSIPSVKATLLLLQEKIPKSAIIHDAMTDTGESLAQDGLSELPVRRINGFTSPKPEILLLSNNDYHVMITNSGGGYSKWKDLAITRWAEDPTRDNRGSFLYIRNKETGEFWSNTFQPTLKEPDSCEAIFSEGRAEFRRRDHDFDTYTEIIVSPEDDIELRRIRITNRSRYQKTIDATSFAEIVLALPASDMAHPCFSNLFMQTEIIADKQTILLSRRPRSPEETFPWILHVMNVNDAKVTAVSYETDRLKFIGRRKTAISPVAMETAGILSNTQGSVLDPIASIRQEITLDGESSVTIDIITGVADTRAAAMTLAEKYRGRRFANRAFELAQTHSQILLQRLDISVADADLYNRLANAVLYADSRMRGDASCVLANARGQSGLWGYSISGDLPIVLIIIKNPANISIVSQMIQAHLYWRQKGLETDLMIWNEEHGTYRQQLQELLQAAAEASTGGSQKPGKILVRSAEQMSNEDRILIQAVARIVLDDSHGTIAEQTARMQTDRNKIIPRLQTRLQSLLHLPLKMIAPAGDRDVPEEKHLSFANGTGGFSADGSEYVMVTGKGQGSPMPWSNVLANERFGTVVTESGMSYTWAENAHEFRITPWYDDPVCDATGEAIYLRDEDSGIVWSPTPLPRGDDSAYVTRHGFGYSVYEHMSRGIRTTLCVYVALKEPMKFMSVRIRNESGRSRRITVTSYSELVLGEQRTKSAMHVITEKNPATGALFARNPYNADFAGRTAFLDIDGEGLSFTGDRTEFLGRTGTTANPDAMTRQKLSGRIGAKLDPCLAGQAHLSLATGEEKEITVKLGLGTTAEEAETLVAAYRLPGSSAKELATVREYWKRTTSAIHVETPDPSLDLLANGWLVYQIISGRLSGRSGYFQSGGAFGFRDQLQDVMALMAIEPKRAREHLLLCSSRQFVEGDVQHWWHPPVGKGSRTHCSDDYLWLPLAVARYVSITGDAAVLDEKTPFLEGPEVKADEESFYDLPATSAETATIYGHCVRAIERSVNRGEHGLPLMGSGDWNDGMNRVGSGGKGESVWLGFFLYEVLVRFGKVAKARSDDAFAERCADEAAKLKLNLDKNGWDGEWYLRGWYDDGATLGSAKDAECRIDSIPQSWSVLSGAGQADRSVRAMQAVDELLVKREQGLIKLLDPPFDTSEANPGYIKGYVPGVRENGGQYTHAAIWAAMAFARQGNGEKAWEAFDIINPVRHSDTAEKTRVYMAEPYVMAADVYSAAPHSGRGGWTWYTGSAAWMYRFIIESLLGFTVEDGVLHIEPCPGAEWKEYKVSYRYFDTTYRITVIPTSNGMNADKPVIALLNDGKEHDITIRVHARAAE